MSLLESLQNFWESTGIYRLINGVDAATWQTLLMLFIVCVLVYLAIVKGFEPLLLLPIAIGMLLTNLPGGNMFHSDYFMTAGDIDYGEILRHGGLIDILYIGVKTGLYPCLVFIGIGAMTDFTPLISNPKSLLIGAGAQFGVFVAFAGALISGVFTPEEAASIGIIGGADGPTAITVTKTLAPELLGAIAIAAYSYMALIPLIQPPLMRLMTTPEERKIKMTELRKVSQAEKIIFPIVVTIIVALIVPDALVLIGCLMFGNLLNVSGVTGRLSDTAQNALMNIVTIFLGISVGATAVAENFLSGKTLLIIVLGLVAFMISTFGGLLTAKIMCKLTGGKINPLIGSAGVSAVPMAARVAQKEGQKADPSNFLLMHAMGPNVAGVIGSAVAAGVLLACFA
ncbi:MAG: sodium ion-translocating decarboxylase subunit beta [Clostridia bacterium]|nr:sodium ion-translocating decarboxylase subunit beta [Clostridia bacterium]MBQ2248853.1 sodium ion-translocating decarboxylase subunit beta [Clostridia bacterium]MBQ5612194.1 sodium ion-translocating decarboxylase subunit beta [Clostridia bacterium]MBQ5661942.1 sodium ion-translocating decarboxylase subunit beta [Clostridia bacterium]MBQ5772820.1 sodium ion-translocating decarboxylase subunit beta [Clostridia bacterium]